MSQPADPGQAPPGGGAASATTSDQQGGSHDAQDGLKHGALATFDPSEFLKEHSALALAALALVALWLRAVAASRFEPSVTAAILTNTDTTLLITGSVQWFGPLLLLLGTIVAARAAGIAARESGFRSVTFRGRAGVLALFFAVTFMTSAVDPSSVVGLLLITVLFAVDGHAGRASAGQLRLLSTIGAVGTLVFFVVSPLLNGDVWLPAERFDRDGQAPVTVYVLTTDGDSYVVLYEDTRVVGRLKTDSVKRRTYCRTAGRSGGYASGGMINDWLAPSGQKLEGWP